MAGNTRNLTERPNTVPISTQIPPRVGAIKQSTASKFVPLEPPQQTDQSRQLNAGKNIHSAGPVLPATNTPATTPLPPAAEFESLISALREATRKKSTIVYALAFLLNGGRGGHTRDLYKRGAGYIDKGELQSVLNSPQTDKGRKVLTNMLRKVLEGSPATVENRRTAKAFTDKHTETTEQSLGVPDWLKQIPGTEWLQVLLKQKFTVQTPDPPAVAAAGDALLAITQLSLALRNRSAVGIEAPTSTLRKALQSLPASYRKVILDEVREQFEATSKRINPDRSHVVALLKDFGATKADE